MTTQTKAWLVYGLAILTVLGCVAAGTAKVCADKGGHYHVFWCTFDK
jgi:hypothetical protein